MSADCILLIIGITFQHWRSTDSDPWSFFNLAWWFTSLHSRACFSQDDSLNPEGFAGIPHLSPFPSMEMSWAQTESSSNQCLGPYPRHFLTIKPCVLSKPELNEICPPPAGPRTNPSLNSLSVFSYHKSRSTSANIKAHKSEIRHIKMKMVPKRLERFPEMTIAVIFGIRCRNSTNVIPAAACRLWHLPSSALPQAHAAPPRAAPQWRH